jgi:hypothetical protein
MSIENTLIDLGLKQIINIVVSNPKIFSSYSQYILDSMHDIQQPFFSFIDYLKFPALPTLQSIQTYLDNHTINGHSVNGRGFVDAILSENAWACPRQLSDLYYGTNGLKVVFEDLWSGHEKVAGYYAVPEDVYNNAKSAGYAVRDKMQIIVDAATNDCVERIFLGEYEFISVTPSQLNTTSIDNIILSLKSNINYNDNVLVNIRNILTSKIIVQNVKIGIPEYQNIKQPEPIVSINIFGELTGDEMKLFYSGVSVPDIITQRLLKQTPSQVENTRQVLKVLNNYPGAATAIDKFIAEALTKVPAEKTSTEILYEKNIGITTTPDVTTTSKNFDAKKIITPALAVLAAFS